MQKLCKGKCLFETAGKGWVVLKLLGRGGYVVAGLKECHLERCGVAKAF